jgi:hypothetical protein
MDFPAETARPAALRWRLRDDACNVTVKVTPRKNAKAVDGKWALGTRSVFRLQVFEGRGIESLQIHPQDSLESAVVIPWVQRRCDRRSLRRGKRSVSRRAGSHHRPEARTGAAWRQDRLGNGPIARSPRCAATCAVRESPAAF